MSARGCLALACSLLAVGSEAAPPKSKHRIDALQWNPGRECLVDSPSCRTEAEKKLTELLQDKDIDLDLATVIGFGDQSYVAPKGWERITSVGKSDSTTLFYNGTRWKKTAVKTGGSTSGCMVGGEGSYAIISLYHVDFDYNAVMVAANFPPPPNFDQGVEELAAAMRYVSTYSFESSFLLMADTNINQTDEHGSSKELMTRLGARQPDLTVTTDPENTCCLDSGFTSNLDRVVATIGLKFSTQVLFQPTPTWAVGKFHRAIIGSLHMPMLKSQGDVTYV
mmetsp:Transcript_51465/g.129972  ORF Transcript_51465/g.129972 Transcript_51465/m.129972 type:complete len:280 (+) Transcript_51465:56-895(+)